MHLSSTQVDVDYIPELGFSSRDFGSKYHNLDSTTVLCDLFTELPSMVAIDKFNSMYICGYQLYVKGQPAVAEEIWKALHCQMLSIMFFQF